METFYDGTRKREDEVEKPPEGKNEVWYKTADSNWVKM